MKFKTREANIKVHELLDKVIRDFDKFDIKGEKKDIKEKLTKVVPNSDKLKICMVGQYSSGKSSILKMLTGNEEIKIAADIATEKAESYDWKGILITDTPGIDHNLRPEHDVEATKAIDEADMLMYVITNELFDNNNAEMFRKLAYDRNRYASMILVVNKMSRANKGNTTEQQNYIKEDVAKVTGERTPDDFYITFIDAKDYLEAQKVTDEEDKEDLLLNSGYDDFIQTLDSFVKGKGLMSKLIHPLYECQKVLEELGADTTLQKTDDEIKGVVESLENAAKDMRDTIDEYCEIISDTFRKAGEGVAATVQVGRTREDVQQEVDSAQKSIKEEVDSSIEALYEKCKRLGEQCSVDVKQNEMSIDLRVIGLEDVDLSGIKQNADGGTLHKMIKALDKSNAIQRTRELLRTGEDPLQVKERILLDRVIKGDNLAKKADIVLKTGNIVLDAYDIYEKERYEEKLETVRGTIRNTYNKNAAKLKDVFKKSVSPLAKVFDDLIEEEHAKEKEAELRKKDIQLIQVYQEEIKQLIAEFDS